MVIEGVSFGEMTKMRQQKCFHPHFSALSQPRPGVRLFTLANRKKHFTFTLVIEGSPWIATYPSTTKYKISFPEVREKSPGNKITKFPQSSLKNRTSNQDFTSDHCSNPSLHCFLF
jgi:hypothetical protein